MLETNQLLDRLSDLVGRTKRAGADAVDAVLIESRGLEVAVRKGNRETLERSDSMNLGVRVFVGDRSASVATEDFRDQTLNDLAERVVAMAKVAPPDHDSRLANVEELAREFPELDLIDGTEPTPEKLLEMAEVAEASALEIKGVDNSEGGGASWGKSGIALVTSNGFASSYARSSFSLSASVIAKKGDSMERDYDWTAATHLSDLRSAQEVGRTAGERAVRRLGARRVKSQMAPVIFEQRLAGGLISSFAAAINGASIARGVSYLKDSMEQQVFSDCVTIIDNPLIPRGMASKPFDGEGLAAKELSLVVDGKLQAWTLDLRSAKKLGMNSNGRASRGVGSNPSPSATNMDLQAGLASPEVLIGEVESGLFVTELIGHGGDLATGDYSRGASGYWIEKGEITYPVNELTIAGNLKDMFRSLTPGSDLMRRGSINAPTVRIDGLTIAGQ